MAAVPRQKVPRKEEQVIESDQNPPPPQTTKEFYHGDPGKAAFLEKIQGAKNGAAGGKSATRVPPNPAKSGDIKRERTQKTNVPKQKSAQTGAPTFNASTAQKRTIPGDSDHAQQLRSNKHARRELPQGSSSLQVTQEELEIMEKFGGKSNE